MVFAREMAARLRLHGVDVVEFFVESRSSPRQLWHDFHALRASIASHRIVVVHAQYGAVTGLLAALAAGRHKFVLNVRGSDLNRVPSENLLRNQLARLMTRAAAIRSDAVVCVSAALQRQLWCVGRKSVVIPSGVDMALFHPMEQAVARQALGWRSDERVVLFNAGLAPTQKGQPLVERAITRLGELGLACRLEIVRGERSRHDMMLLLNAADCAVLASESEGSPNIVKEAMACNLPVVSVRVGDVQERMQCVRPVAIVDRSEHSLATGMHDVLTVGGRSNGKEVLERQGLSLDASSAKLCALYRSVVANDEFALNRR